MIQVQMLVGDLHRGHLGSPEIINRFLIIPNSRLKRAQGGSQVGHAPYPPERKNKTKFNNKKTDKMICLDPKIMGQIREVFSFWWGVPWARVRLTLSWTKSWQRARARDTGVVSLWLSCHGASTDVQHGLLGPVCDLTWLWRRVKYWHDHSKSVRISFDALWREEHDIARIIPPA